MVVVVVHVTIDRISNRSTNTVAIQLASTQDRIGAAGPPHALRSAGGFLDEESVIYNHGFGTNLGRPLRGA